MVGKEDRIKLTEKLVRRKEEQKSYKINLKGIDTFMNNISVTPLKKIRQTVNGRGVVAYTYLYNMY